MRGLIINRLNGIEKQTDNFTSGSFCGFFVGGFKLSRHPPFEGMPDGILLTVFEEVILHLGSQDDEQTELYDNLH